MGAIGWMGVMAAFFVAGTIWLIVYYYAKHSKVLKELTQKLGGEVVSRRGRRGLEIPGEPDGPIRYENFTRSYGENNSVPVTEVTVPICLSSPMRMGLVQHGGWEGGVGEKVGRFITGHSSTERFSKLYGPLQQIGDPELEKSYAIFSDRPEILKETLSVLGPALMQPPVGFWTILPVKGEAAKHLVSYSIERSIVDPSDVLMLVNSVRTVTGAIRDALPR